MLESLFETIVQKREASLSQDLGPYPKNQPTPSDLSECARETTLQVIHWQSRPPFATQSRARMDVGTLAERHNLSQLSTLGFEIVEQQRMFEYRDTRGRLILRGKIDGKVVFPAIRKRPIMFDHKTVSPFIFPRLNSVEDLKKQRWYKKWVKQMYAYMFLDSDDISFLFLDNNLGEWKFIEIPLNYEEAELTIAQCETAVDAIEAIQRLHISEEEALPSFTDKHEECQQCWARGKVCFPPFAADGYQLLDDAELEAKLDRMAEIEEAADEYAALEKDVKRAIEKKNGLIIGDWLIEGKEISFTKKAQPAKPEQSISYWKPKITRLTTQQESEAT